jgi:hypothetical protein
MNINNVEGEESQSQSPDVLQGKREIYPEVNDRFKGTVLWLGLGFIVLVFLVQHFSGYS